MNDQEWLGGVGGSARDDGLPHAGGKGGDCILAAGSFRRRYRAEDDTGPIVFQIGDELDVMRIESDGSVSVRKRQIGVKREIYLGLRTLSIEISEGKLVTTGPAMLNGVEVPAGQFTMRWELSPDGDMKFGTGRGGKGINGGPDGRPGRILFYLATGYELMRIDEDGVFVRGGEVATYDHEIIEALQEWLEACD